MMSFLGKDAEYWIRLRAILRKANVEDLDQLEAILKVTPPIYETRWDDHKEIWLVVERSPQFGIEEIVGWSRVEGDAVRICRALKRDGRNATV